MYRTGSVGQFKTCCINHKQQQTLHSMVHLSGCQICASTGQCNTAFHSGPGQYCGSYYDISISETRPCCCPLDSTCKVSYQTCQCHVERADDERPPSSRYYNYPSSDHQQGSTTNRIHYAPNYYHQYDNTSPLMVPL